MARLTALREERPPYGAVPVHVWWRLVAIARDVLARSGTLDGVQRARASRGERRRSGRVLSLAPAILSSVAERHPELGSESWRADVLLPTLSDVAVFMVGPPEDPFEAVVMVAETPAAAEGIQWQETALSALHDDQRLGEWRSLLPEVLDTGTIEGTHYLIEKHVRGMTLEQAVTKPASRDGALRAAADAIHRLHHATAGEATVDQAMLERLVLGPVGEVARLAEHARVRPASLAALARLSDELCTALEGQTLALSWAHGDFAPGNILADADGRITGILDWEFAHPQGLPALDIVFFLLTARVYARRQELGRVVRDLVVPKPVWSPAEAELIAATAGASIGFERLALLSWLHHAAQMITRCTRYVDSGLWIHSNIRVVLDSLA
ncbi:MAG TPA: aminoglycoside phosphotransferase family protein [Polyangiaceae bacterium]